MADSALKPNRGQPELRLNYLDGVRGIASWIVVFHHASLAFGWTILISYAGQSAIKKRLAGLARSFLGLIFAGHFSVLIFFVHSGLVLSLKYFSDGKRRLDLGDSAIRRYPRLLGPVVACTILGYILVKLSLTHTTEVAAITGSSTWLAHHYVMVPNFFGALKQGFIYTFFGSVPLVDSYDSSLWTLGAELMGSYLVLSFLALFGRTSLRWFFYLVALIYFNDSYYFAFLLGVITSDLFVLSRKFSAPKQLGTVAGGLLIFLALYLGAYTSSSVPGYGWLHFVDDNKWFEQLQSIAATSLIVGVICLKSLRCLLGRRFFEFLGEISYSVYAVHIPILCSLTCILFLHLKTYAPTHLWRVSLVSFFITVPVILVLAVLLRRYFDEPSIRLGKYIAAWAKSEEQKIIASKPQTLSDPILVES